MKLWQKISILCGLIVALTIAACTYVQLMETHNHLVGETCMRNQRRQESLAVAFDTMVSYYRDDEAGEAEENALLHYCFTRLADRNCALAADGKIIWGDPPEELKEDILEDREEKVNLVVGTGTYIMNGSAIIFGTRRGTRLCWVFTWEKLTGIQDTVRQMAGQFARIGLGFTALGVVLIILVVVWATKPLSALEKAASQIADGDYGQRARVRSRDEVGALAVSFNRMADSVEINIAQLREAAQRQKLFTGAVTHEFKTPLTGILLSADSLQNTFMDEEEQNKALTAIQNQGKWLERLVQKLLKLLTLEQELTLDTVSVPELLERVRESTAEVLGQRGVALDVQCGVDTLEGDVDLLQSALVNLVDNASKASQPGQGVTLAAFENVIEVRDQGTGIPPEALGRITEPFYMADRSRSKRQGGVGLGLALVREIVDAHGAAMEVESTLGVGTTVRIRFQEK